MKKIYFATRVRGFFKHLFNEKNIKWTIVGNKDTYEINSSNRKLISKLVRGKLLDYLGIIQVKKCRQESADMYGSFNRFLNADKPYFIYLENPTALYHYSLGRAESYLGKRNILNRLNDKNLKSVVCMSKACYETFDKLCGVSDNELSKHIVYPYVPENRHIDEEKIIQRCKEKHIELLFISQGIRFISKGGLEVVEAFKKLRKNNTNINLTIITSQKDIDESIIENIKEIEGINMLEFGFSYNELEKIYSNSTILLHPTSDDSFGLTILEAMKSGLPIISTDLYAIPEMVKDGVNGFLTEPKFWFFDKKNMPNKEVWNNRNSTIYSTEISIDLVNFIYDRVLLLNNDRDILLSMSKKSYFISNEAPFSTEYIINQWNDIICNY